MPKVTVGGIDLHYMQVGQGPDLIFLHGLTGNLAIWHFTLVPVFKDSFRTTTYDLRGHGRSDMPRTGYTTRHMAQDLRGLMDALSIQKAHLVGHSLGADIALHTALLYPERVEKVVAVEAGTAALVELRKQHDWPGWQEWATAIERYGGQPVPRDRWNDIDYMLRKSLTVPIVFGPGRGMPRKPEHLTKLLDTTTVVDEYQDAAGMTLEAISQIQHQVLLVYGSQSNYLGTYDQLRDVLPNHQAALLDGSEHFGALERPAELSEHIWKFLNEEGQPLPGTGS